MRRCALIGCGASMLPHHVVTVRACTLARTGCEFELADDVIKYSPRFFESIDQLAIETHLARTWMGNNGTLMKYGRLMALLQRAGFVIQDVSLNVCGIHGNKPVLPLNFESGYQRRTHCGAAPSCLPCENLLFARPVPAKLRPKDVTKKLCPGFESSQPPPSIRQRPPASRPERKSWLASWFGK